MNEQHIIILKEKFAQCIRFFQPMRKMITKYTVHDREWVFVILFLAALLRLPFIAHPDVTQFDELIYTNFILHILNHQPFFDIHPPLARMLFAEIAQHSGSFNTVAITMKLNQPFGDFPFVPLRYFSALLGSILPLMIYTLGRILKYPPRSAALPALFIVFDSAFIIYSRAILPDTLLLCLNFLALGSAFLLLRVENKKLSTLLLVIMSIAIGCALSIKWLALGVLGTIWVLFLSERRIGAIVASGLIALLVYVMIFTAFFFNFRSGGHIDPMLPAFDTPLIRQVSFPKTNNLITVLKFLPEHHQTMLDANKIEGIEKIILPGPSPLTWPASRSAIDFWIGANGQKITFQGNSLLWMVSFLLLLFHIGWILWHVKHERKWPLQRDETILLVGYALNYLPFFLIQRPMYLYHYLTAAILLFLMIPKIAPRMIHCLAILSRDRLFAVTLAGCTVVLIVVNFILSMPTIYGF